MSRAINNLLARRIVGLDADAGAGKAQRLRPLIIHFARSRRRSGASPARSKQTGLLDDRSRPRSAATLYGALLDTYTSPVARLGLLSSRVPHPVVAGGPPAETDEPAEQHQPEVWSKVVVGELLAGQTWARAIKRKGRGQFSVGVKVRQG